MELQIISAVMLPFLGTTLGSAFVYFMKGAMNRRLQRMLTGFASGVMVAASVWSLIIPAMDQSAHMGKLAFLPAAVGIVIRKKDCIMETETKGGNRYEQIRIPGDTGHHPHHAAKRAG